jgi:hypothetical protein
MTKMRRRSVAVSLSAALALGAFAAGCGDDNKDKPAGSGGTTTHSSHQAAGGDGAATLRANLTAGLQEHVYLAGIAVVQGVNQGLDSPQFKAAAATLDKNSVALSDAIGSVYGMDAGDQFLALWRKHIGFFVDYTKAKATKDAKGVAKAEADLDGYRQEFGAFLASANPNLTQDAVAQELKGHVQSLFAAIDAVVSKDPTVFDKLAAAAAHMPMTAAILSGAIAKQYPDKFAGSTTAGASELRAGLTALLQEHVYEAGIAVAYGVGAGLDSGEFKAAAASLDKNSVALSEAIGSVYGKPAGSQFLALWRKHIGFFVDYTKAKATKDAAGAAKAKAGLNSYRQEFGAFLASANPNLTQKAVADELKPHVQTLFDAIDAVVGKSPKVFDRLQVAAAHMPMTAEILSGAIAKQFPDKFPTA